MLRSWVPTQYSTCWVHWALHTRCTESYQNRLCSTYSQSLIPYLTFLRRHCCTPLFTFAPLWVTQCIESLLPVIPSFLSTTSRLTTSKYSTLNLTWTHSALPYLPGCDLQDRITMASKCIRILARSQPLNAAPGMHYPVHNISKRKFCPGRMAPYKWMRCVRSITDTPMAGYAAPGINAMSQVANCPPISVSPFLLALSVFYFIRTLWRCGQSSAYVGTDSLGMPLQRYCNATVDTAIISPHIPSTCTQDAIFSFGIIHIIASSQIYVGIEYPSLVLSISCFTTSSDLWNYVSSGQCFPCWKLAKQ